MSNVSLQSQGWEDLHRYVYSQIHQPLDPVIIRVLWLTIALCPVSGLLYLVSGIKRMKTTGFWFCRMDPDGFLHPNIHAMIPCFCWIYTTVNFVGMLLLQRDLQDYIKTPAVVLHILTYPILFGFGWTKVWATVYASPPTKFRLHQHCQQAGKPVPKIVSTRFLRPSTFNILVVGGYVLPFLFTVPTMGIIGHYTSQINKSWVNYDAASKVIVDPTSSQQLKGINQRIALLNLAVMNDSYKKILVVNRAISGGYLIMDSILLASLLIASFHIIRALWFQVTFFRESSKRRREIRLDSFVPIISESSSFRLVDRTAQLMSTSESLTEVKLEYDGTSSEKRSFTFDDSWSSWLPSFKRGTEVDASTWRSRMFNRPTQEWEAVDGYMLVRQYQSLRTYTSNTLWQAVLASCVTCSYMILNWISLLNVMRVPEKHSVTWFTIFVVTWTNITWNLGIGIILGIISCIVAFSPMPSMPQEPSERFAEYEEST